MAVHQLPRPLNLAAAGALVLALGLAACGGDDGPAATTVATTIDVITVPDTAASTQADDGFIDRADSAACDADERTIEVAIDAFEALNGRLPVSIDELVTAGFLRAASTNFEVDPNGAVVPLDSGRCG